MLSFGSTPDWKSISAIRKVRGSVEPTRTPTGCCGSTFPKVQTSADTLSESSTQWLSPSTADLERRSPGERQPKHSTRSCEDEINQLLAPHRAPPSDAFASDCTAMKILEVRCDRRLRCDDQLSLGSTAIAFGTRCTQLGIRPSMGSVGDCFDNAMAESVFATLEC